MRQALGLTTQHLAKKIGINQSNVVRFEEAEQNGAITLNSIRKVAEAMDCQQELLTELLSGSPKKVWKDDCARIPGFVQS